MSAVYLAYGIRRVHSYSRSDGGGIVNASTEEADQIKLEIAREFFSDHTHLVQKMKPQLPQGDTERQIPAVEEN